MIIFNISQRADTEQRGSGSQAVLNLQPQKKKKLHQNLIFMP